MKRKVLFEMERTYYLIFKQRCIEENLKVGAEIEKLIIKRIAEMQKRQENDFFKKRDLSFYDLDQD